MRSTSPLSLLATGLLIATASLVAACGSTSSTTTTPTTGHISSPTMGGVSSSTTPGGMATGSMPGMDMAAAVPGHGLLDSASGFTLISAASTVTAGHASIYRFRIVGPDRKAVTTYQLDQTKLLHFYLVRSDLTGFEHLHPTLASDGTWSVDVNPASAGTYRVYTQFIAGAASHPTDLVLSTPLTVTGPASATVALPAPAATTQVDGYDLGVKGELKAGTTSPLTISVSRGGQPVTDLQPYLDTYAHLTAFHQGDMGFAHLHPLGAVHGDTGGPTLTFAADLTEVGQYRLFAQFQTGGVLHTAQVTVAVR